MRNDDDYKTEMCYLGEGNYKHQSLFILWWEGCSKVGFSNDNKNKTTQPPVKQLQYKNTDKFCIAAAPFCSKHNYGIKTVYNSKIKSN